jgi:hypothetical protein
MFISALGLLFLLQLGLFPEDRALSVWLAAPWQAW